MSRQDRGDPAGAMIDATLGPVISSRLRPPAREDGGQPIAPKPSSRA